MELLLEFLFMVFFYYTGKIARLVFVYKFDIAKIKAKSEEKDSGEYSKNTIVGTVIIILIAAVLLLYFVGL